MDEKITGKKVKLNDFNMTYGKQEKILNIIGFFKYKKDNNLYAISCDDSLIVHGIINYGSAHLKGNTLIIIGSKNPDQEMIKELLYQISNDETPINFEFQDLSTINAIELVSPNKFEMKKEVLQMVSEKTIPTPQITSPQKQETKKKNKILPILLIIIVLSAAFIYFKTINNSNTPNITKSIVCTKEYESNDLEAKVLEDNTYNFNQNDILQYINKSMTYQFYEEEEYYDFVNKGLYYNYAPLENGSYRLEDETHSFVIIEKEDTTKDYFLPTEYEEVLSYYKDKKYSCIEQIEE